MAILILAIGLLASRIADAIQFEKERRAAREDRARFLEHIARLERMLIARDASDAASAERIIAAAHAAGVSDLTVGAPPPAREREPDQFDEMWADVPRGPRKE